MVLKMSFKCRVLLIVVFAFVWIIGVHGQCHENRTVLVLKANTTMQTFHSPNYPNPYPRYSYCQWLIESPSVNHSLEMVTKHLDIELYDSGCNFDRITVYSGVKKSRSSGRRFCMGNLTVTSGPQLLVVFESDGRMSGTGFRFGYFAFWNPPVTSTPSPPSKSKGVDKWVVIGGVAGGIAFIIIVTLICCRGCGGSREPRRPPSHHAAGYYHSHGPPTPLHGSPGDGATFSTSVHMMQQSSNTVFMVSQSVGGNVPPPHVLTDLRNGVTNMGYEDGAGDPALGPGGGLGPPIGVPPPSYSESMLQTNPPSVPPTPRHTPGRLPALPVYVHSTGLAPPPLFAPRGGPAPVPGSVSEGGAASGGTTQQTGGTTQQTGPPPPPCDQTPDSAPEAAPPPAVTAASPGRTAALPTIAETVTEPAVETAGQNAVAGMSAQPTVVEIPSQSADEPPEATTGEPSARSSVVEPSDQPVVQPSMQPSVAAESAQPEPATQPEVVATSAQPVVEPSTQPTVVATSVQPEQATQPGVVATSAQPEPPTQPTVVATSEQPAVEPPAQQTQVATSTQPVIEPPTQPAVATSAQPEDEPATQPAVVATSAQPTRDEALEQITDIETCTQSAGDRTSAQLSTASSDAGHSVNDPNQRAEASADPCPSPKDVSALGPPSQTPGSPGHEPQAVDQSGLSPAGIAEHATEEVIPCSEENHSSASPPDVRLATECHSSSRVEELISDTNEQALVESQVSPDTTSSCNGTDQENNIETAPMSGTPSETPQSDTLTCGQQTMASEIVTASQALDDEEPYQAQDSTHTDVREDLQTVPASDENVTSVEHNENSSEPFSKDDDPVSLQSVDEAVSEANTNPEDKVPTAFVPPPPVSDDRFHDHVERSASGSTLPPPAILYTCESLDSDPDSFPAPPPPLAED